MNNQKRELLRSILLAMPSSTLLILLGIIPLVMLVVFSFSQTTMTVTAIQHFTLDHWIKIFTERTFLSLMLKSLGIAAVVTLACILIAYPTAWGIAKVVDPNSRSTLLMFTIIPFFTSQLLLMYTIMVLLTGNGIVMSALGFLGLADPGASILYTVKAVVVILIYEDFSMMILCLYSSLEKIDTSVIEASHTLGAGRIRTFFYIVLPQSMPGLLSGIFLVFIPVAGSYAESTRAGGPTGMMIGSLINSQYTAVLNMGYGAALSCAFLAVVALIMAVIGRLSQRLNRVLGGE